METLTTENDLSRYIVTLPHDDYLPKDAPREKLDLMIHHAQVEAQNKAYHIIERETGLMREDLTHRWLVNDGASVCVFSHRDTLLHEPEPGILLVK